MKTTTESLAAQIKLRDIEYDGACLMHALNLPEVDMQEIGSDSPRAVKICVGALAPHHVFVSEAGRIVEVFDHRAVDISRHGMRLLLCDAIAYYGAKNPDGKQSTAPPLRLAEEVLARGSAFRRLAGVTPCPVVSTVGAVTAEGYDTKTKLFVSPRVELEGRGLPDTAAGCAAELLALVSDFPFLTDADRGVWLAMLASALLRPSIRGAVPGFVITATTRGTGKTLLASVVVDAINGEGAGIGSEPANQEEAKKVITSEAIRGTRVMVWDNLANGKPFGDSVVDSLLTSDVYTDRLLGGNATVTVKLPFILVCTGNNVGFQADTARRILVCKLQTDLERPQDRQHYVIENLRAHILANRARILGVVVQMIRLGMSTPVRAPRVGSFEAWGESVGKILLAAGYDLTQCFASADPEADDTDNARAFLLEYMARKWPNGCTALQLSKDAVRKMEDYGADPADSAAGEALEHLTQGRVRSSSGSSAIGYALRAFKSSNVRGWILEHKRTSTGGVWVARKA